MNIEAIKELVAEIESDPYEQANAERDKVRSAYLSVFGTAKGALVLADILRDLHFMDVATDPAHVVLQNYAALLLMKLGANSEDHRVRVVDNLLKLARITENQQKDS